MSELTPLERASLVAILDELSEERAAVEGQLRNASALSRENTGGGFYTDLLVADAKTLDPRRTHLGQNVWVGVEGMELGLGIILHYRSGLPYLLEGYAVGPNDTSKIDFEQARFAIIDKPGPIPSNGS